MPKFVNPIEILNKLDLKDDMIAVDFGCGSGGWVIPLAKKIEQGIIYAIDVQEEMLSVLESFIKHRRQRRFKIISYILRLSPNDKSFIPGGR